MELTNPFLGVGVCVSAFVSEKEEKLVCVCPKERERGNNIKFWTNAHIVNDVIDYVFDTHVCTIVYSFHAFCFSLHYTLRRNFSYTVYTKNMSSEMLSLKLILIRETNEI